MKLTKIKEPSCTTCKGCEVCPDPSLSPEEKSYYWETMRCDYCSKEVDIDNFIMLENEDAHIDDELFGFCSDACIKEWKEAK